MNNKNILDIAKDYKAQGLSIFPTLPNDKKPAIKWAEYQTRLATDKELETWFGEGSNYGIGIVTGKISGIVVVDVEAGGNINDYPLTVMTQTGGGGYHLYFKWPGIKIKNGERVRELTDIRGDGGFVVAPPTIHASGNRYEWLASFGETELADLPQWVIDLQDSPQSSPLVPNLSPGDKIKEGRRNSESAKMAGKLLYELKPEDWETVGWAGLNAWNNSNCEPPLSTEELKGVWESIKKRQASSLQKRREKEIKPRCVEETLSLIRKGGWNPEFFADQTGKPFVRFTNNGHKETWGLESKNFGWLLAKYLYEKTSKVPARECLVNVNKILATDTMNKQKIKLATRVAQHNDAIWYDLSNDDWSAIRIDKDGWEIMPPPVPLFYRHSHQKAQLNPIHGGNPWQLLDFININDPDIQKLFLVTMISYFIPEMPHPALIISGSQGSAKSVLCQMSKAIIDPSSLGISAIPERMGSLIQVLAHHWISFFDNVSFIKDEISDLFCKVITGSGFSKRELYSDDGDIIYNIQHSLGINSINNVAIKPDLLERGVVIELERISEDKRKLEKELWTDFNQALPGILGGIFDTISQAMAIREHINLPNKPRMADFAFWGSAIAEALGIGQEDFLRIYAQNQELQNSIALNEDNFATILIEFLEEQGDWDGKAQQLLITLTEWARGRGYEIGRNSHFPTTASTLSRRINSSLLNLRTLGIEASLRGPRRQIRLRWNKKEEQAPAEQNSPKDLGDYFDDLN